MIEQSLTAWNSALGASICKVAHGLDIAEQDDERIDVFDKALESMDVLIEGSTILEYFPFLTMIPTWLPGTGFLRRLAEHRKYAHMLRELPWTQAEQMAVSFVYNLHVRIWSHILAER